MKIAITGGAGFLGSAIASELRTLGHRVVVLDSARRLRRAVPLLTGVTTENFDFPHDASVVGRFSEVDILIHLACTTTPATSMNCKACDAVENVAPSVAVFENAVNSGVRRIVFASSGGTVYGKVGTLPVGEDSPTHPISAYGVSKLALEHYLRISVNGKRCTGISLRLANPYGPYQFRGGTIGVLAKFLCAIRDGRPIHVLGDGTVVRDYVYIGDVVHAFVAAALDCQIESGPYNVGSGRGCSIKELIDTAFEQTGKSVPVTFSDNREFDVPAIALDSGKLSRICGWRPTTGLQDGVALMWQHARAAFSEGLNGGN